MSTNTRRKGRTTPQKRPDKAAVSTTRVGARMKIAIAGILAVVVLAAIFTLNNRSENPTTGNGAAGRYAFAVGDPGPGQMAPAIQLPATSGSSFDLGAQHGKSVLLYFQEGLTCQPCWDQLKDIEQNMSRFRALGVDQVISVTSDPLAALKQKSADERLTSPVLADPNLAVSRAYSANQYGMMGESRDGHSFVLVGPDGRIRWRADYGGAPDYTMYVPVANLLADLRHGINAGGA